ncbi:hypothetical protein M3639_20935, partial [Alkalihalobacillus rhizosphaerae]
LRSAPPYVASQDVRDLETRYVARHVVYLLGQADTNPTTHFIDRSCAAMAQGPYRLARGLAYFDYLKKRHPDDLAQQVVEVPGCRARRPRHVHVRLRAGRVVRARAASIVSGRCRHRAGAARVACRLTA